MKADMFGVSIVSATPNVRFSRLSKPIIEKLPYGLTLGSYRQPLLVGS